MAKIQLGQEVKDRVSGFQGIAIATTHYLQGCDRILVQPKVNKEGELPESRAFDEPDLVIVGEGILPKKEKGSKENGGPRPIASRAKSPTMRT